jgi:hypothetical protein
VKQSKRKKYLEIHLSQFRTLSIALSFMREREREREVGGSERHYVGGGGMEILFSV